MTWLCFGQIFHVMALSTPYPPLQDAKVDEDDVADAEEVGQLDDWIGWTVDLLLNI